MNQKIKATQLKKQLKKYKHLFDKNNIEVTFFYDGTFQLLRRSQIQANKYYIASSPFKTIKEFKEFIKNKLNERTG